MRTSLYPYGWQHEGRFNNHNLYDVASLYKLGWPYLSETARAAARQKIKQMLDWSLANTLTKDGTYKFDPSFSDSLMDEYYFGVSLLDLLGYWQPSRRFWTDAPTAPEAPALCCWLKQSVSRLGIEGWALSAVREKLGRNCTC